MKVLAFLGLLVLLVAAFAGGIVIADLDIFHIMEEEAEEANHSPNQPTNSSPRNGATGVSLTPTLQSSAFSDLDAGNTHAASQWQIRSASGN